MTQECRSCRALTSQRRRVRSGGKSYHLAAALLYGHLYGEQTRR